MISSKFVNELFSAIAGLVNQLTGKNIQFEEVQYQSTQEDACAKVNRFSKAIREALAGPLPLIGKVDSLEPGKIYCLQIDETVDNWTWIENISKGLVDQGILLVVIGQNMNFVSIPEGYEIIKKDERKIQESNL